MPHHIIVIGAGPAGLIASEYLANDPSVKVIVYDKMRQAGRKLLLAGRGGLNITHSDPLDEFIKAYGEASTWIEPYIRNFSPQPLCEWAKSLGEECFTGTSRRVFPKSLKASPLLRAWLERLTTLGVTFQMEHEWQGWHGDHLHFINKEHSDVYCHADAVICALGGASWPRLGSDGSWLEKWQKQAIEVVPWQGANMGVQVIWSEDFIQRFAGHPLKPVCLRYGDHYANQGELMITKHGIEGNALYPAIPLLRKDWQQQKPCTLYLNLRPTMSVQQVEKRLGVRKNKQSFSDYLRKGGFSSLAVQLLYETLGVEYVRSLSQDRLANYLLNIPIQVTGPMSIDRAISSAGGVSLEAITTDLMVKNRPGLFVAGEMINWEAPTGGYLLQGCFSTGIAAAKGVLRYLNGLSSKPATE
jgi:uncharacterized flavoprotein (TIGR03862 family)